MSTVAALTVVGIGDDGCVGLSSRAVNAVAQATVLAGGQRHLSFFPQFSGERIVVKGDLAATITRLVELTREHHVCVLASGDPLYFGIGARLADAVGSDHVRFIPSLSSAQLACAAIGMEWGDALTISLHGRPLAGLCARLRQTRKAVVLTDGHNSPQRIARHLIEFGCSELRAWLCERLGGPEQRVREMTLTELRDLDHVEALNVLVLAKPDPDFRPPAMLPFLSDAEFDKRTPKRGLITKREVRALALASLKVSCDAVVWDVGAGSGSVAIEASVLASQGHVFAVEADPRGVELCLGNARAHGADNVTVVHGRATLALAALPDPDAVFIGGSDGALHTIIETSYRRLRPGGTMVVNAATLQSQQQAHASLHGTGCPVDVLLVQVARAVSLGSYQRFEALNPVQVLSVQKPGSQPREQT